jgi:hypothetical protein
MAIGGGKAMAVNADPDLGRVLLEQKPNRGNIGNGCFLLLLALPMMGVVAAPTAPLGVRLGLFGLGLCLSGFSAVMLWRHWMYVFLQERGIREYRRGKGRSLAYDLVDEVRYSSARIFLNGSYIHTVQKLALRSGLSREPPLVCTLIFKELDGDAPGEARTALTQVRDATSLFLADRFLERIMRDETVVWAPGVRINRRGVETEDRGAWALVEWGRVSKMDIDEGTLQLWTHEESKPRLRLSMTEPNSYPAYAMALRLMRQSSAG